MASITVSVGGRSDVVLADKDYLSQGGQGSVWRIGNVAYKVYHDLKGMIPEAKIAELSAINLKNVLGPQDTLYDKKRQPIGFTMPFVSNTEYITRLFNLSFKKNNNITPEMVTKLVRRMMETLKEIHSKGYVVGDYNEMNFLVSKKWDEVYHIDVDSYQTPSFPCTAIMDSVRDRAVKMGHFDQNTDWFSWAVVTFQMFTGIHPYKGNHPSYKKNDFDSRMRDNISVFNKDVTMPSAFGDWSVIPPNLLAWYKEVFDNGYRGVPDIDTNAIGAKTWKVGKVTNGAGVTFQDLYDYGSEVTDMLVQDGVIWSLSADGVWRLSKKVADVTTQSNIKLVKAYGDDPGIVVERDRMLEFFTYEKYKIGEVQTHSWMVSDGTVYADLAGKLVRCRLQKSHTVKLFVEHAASVMASAKFFPGVLVQSVFGKAMLTIPYTDQDIANTYVPEINGLRFVDAARKGRWFVGIAEKNGKYDRICIHFASDFNSYSIAIESDVSETDVNFAVRQNGLMLLIVGDSLRLLGDLKSNSKEVPGTALGADTEIHDALDKVIVLVGNTIKKISMI